MNFQSVIMQIIKRISPYINNVFKLILFCFIVVLITFPLYMACYASNAWFETVLPSIGIQNTTANDIFTDINLTFFIIDCVHALALFLSERISPRRIKFHLFLMVLILLTVFGYISTFIFTADVLGWINNQFNMEFKPVSSNSFVCLLIVASLTILCHVPDIEEALRKRGQSDKVYLAYCNTLSYIENMDIDSDLRKRARTIVLRLYDRYKNDVIYTNDIILLAALSAESEQLYPILLAFLDNILQEDRHINPTR